ncbi:MAG: cytochrome C oxidase subunit IV family protein [Bdellovibrionota bacterium]|nr:cytochrome C oxidase subunit IV family protein [Deltaproteobacteria bacterium]
MSHTSEHKNHITPLWVYYAVGTSLLFLTMITVAASYIPFSQFTGIGSLNFAVAMIIAIIKATLVALFFMHLAYDNKFYLFSLLAGILCLLIFIVVTMFDTQYRGLINPEEKTPIIQQTAPEQFVGKKHHEASQEDTHH